MSDSHPASYWIAYRVNLFGIDISYPLYLLIGTYKTNGENKFMTICSTIRTEICQKQIAGSEESLHINQFHALKTVW